MFRNAVTGLLLLTGLGLQPALSAGEECKQTSVGLDTTLANNYSGDVFGHSIGQTFLAPSRLLRSIVVWRAAVQGKSIIGMHLYVVATDSSGTPQIDQVILDGPTLVHSDGDGIHDTEFRWVFEPPLQLPHTGTYAFFLRQDPCAAYFDVISRSGDPGAYSDGQLWETQRADFMGCRLRGPVNSYPNTDIIFDAEFCSDAVPVLRRSWGQVKTIYR